MKILRYITTSIMAAGALLLAGSAHVQAQSNLVVAVFPTGTQGQPTGGSYQGYNMSVPYGAGTIVWDGVTFDAADGSTGSAYITANFSGANNTDVLVSMGPGYNNWYYENGQNCPGFLTGTADFSQYHAVQFDILYDTNSALTIGQFNTGSNWPSSYLNAGLGSDYMATNSYYTHGVNVEMFTGSGGATVFLGTVQIPTSASNGWQTVTMPYSDSIGGLSSGAGLWFQGSFGGGSGITNGPYQASFWIDNVVLLPNPVSNPPPKVSIAPAVQGLNLFTGSALNNRESLENTNHNFSWVGASGPVSYSFTLSSYPVPAADQVQNHIFLVPNPAAGSAPDYTEPNVIFLDLESTAAGGASFMFRYKTNQPNGNTMIYGSGTLASIQSPTGGAGTWTVTFNNNTNVTMTGPGGASTNFSIPDPAGATSALFASNVVLFYGTQANSATAENDHTVTSDFNVTGLGSADFDDNFVADAGTLNTNIWMVNAAIAPSVRMVGPGNPYYVSWTLPASGFSLELTPALAPTRTWSAPTSNPSILTGSSQTQLINTNDLPAGNSAFFAMVKRNFSQLLVLLPGEASAPGTITGKSGTPTAQNTVNTVTNVIVLAVDGQFYPVGGITDSIQLSSSDGAAITPTPANMVNGTATFSTFLFQTGGGGTQTITATDTTSTNIPAATSSPVVVN